jgi:DNA-binding transcriptional LysR family regulator
MKLDTLGLEAFVAIAETGRFGRAADALHITQTALSRRLQNLEDLLGVTLVERTTRSVALTRLGRDFLPQARRLLSDLSAALTEIRKTGKAERGDVTIACVPTVGVRFLPRVIQEYATAHPQNRIHILDHASSGVAEAVLRREAEFGINIGGARHAELAAAPLLQDRFVLVCRDDHLLARRRGLSWKDLSGHPLILAGEASGNRPLLDTALARGTIALQAHYEVQRSSTALGLVSAGVAAAVVPGLAVEGDLYSRLRAVPLADPVVSRSLVLLTRKGSHLSPAAQALYDAIADHARARRGDR